MIFINSDPNYKLMSMLKLGFNDWKLFYKSWNVKQVFYARLSELAKPKYSNHNLSKSLRSGEVMPTHL